MKKLHIYLLLPLLSLLLNACLKDNTEAFSTSTALRLDEAAKQSKELLESSETGWILNYYTGRDYSNAGRTLLLKFKDGKATIMGDLTGPEVTSKSDYDVVKDQGVVLTFNTNNEVLHSLTQAALREPEGKQGDYEFLILKQTQDSIYLRGKRWHNNMVLTKLPKDTNWEEYMTEALTVKESLAVNTFKFILGNDTISEGTIDPNSTRLNAQINGTTYDMPFTFTNKGIHLQRPLVVNGVSYSDLTWNAETNALENGNFKAALFIPKGFKPIDFWYGTWTFAFTNTTRVRMNITLTLKPGDGKQYLNGTLDVTVRNGRQSSTTHYPMTLGYNPANGGIYLGAQSVTDPTGKFAGGIRLLPLVINGDKADLVDDGVLTYIWNEDTETAVLTDTGEGSRTVDSFVGFGLGDNLQLILDEHNEPARAFYVPKAVELRNHKPLN